MIDDTARATSSKISTMWQNAHEFRTRPLSEQLSFICRKKVNRWQEVAAELQELNIYTNDAAFFLDLREFGEFYTASLILRQYTERGASFKDMPTREMATQSVYFDMIKTSKRKFFENAIAQLYNKEFGETYDRWVSTLSPNEITYTEARKLMSTQRAELSDLIVEDWLSDFTPYREKTSSAVQHEFRARLPPSLRGHLSYRAGWWYFPVLKMEYRHAGVECVIFSADLHVVADVEPFLQEGQHDFSVAGISYSVSTKEESLGHYGKLFAPAELCVGSLQPVRIPLKMVQGLVEGKTEPEGCHVVECTARRVSYTVEGFDEQVTIRPSLLSWFKRWTHSGGWRGLLQALAEGNSIDSITLELLQQRLSQPVSSSVSASVSRAVNVSVKDMKKLKMITQSKETLTYSQLAKLLGFQSRQGAFDWLQRMVKCGLLAVAKSGKGVQVSLTPSGKNTVTSLPPTPQARAHK